MYFKLNYLTIPTTKENKIETNDNIEPQEILILIRITFTEQFSTYTLYMFVRQRMNSPLFLSLNKLPSLIPFLSKSDW